MSKSCHIIIHNSLTPIEENTPTEVSTSTETPSQTNANYSQVSETVILLINLEKRWLPDLIMTFKLERCYQKPSSWERASQEKSYVLERKILTTENDHNSLEQYERRNNIEITGTPESASDQNLEEKVVDILNEMLMYHQKILKRVIMWVYQKRVRRKQ